MNFATGLCHLIHEYDLIMTSNYVIVSIRLCQVIPRCWNDEYIILCNDGGGGGGSKDPPGGRKKTKPGLNRVNVQRVSILTQTKAFVCFLVLRKLLLVT